MQFSRLLLDATHVFKLKLTRFYAFLEPYPPMPKSELARKGKVAVPEEELSSDEEGMLNPTASSINTATLVMAARAQKDTKRKMLSHGTAEWERVRYS